MLKFLENQEIVSKLNDWGILNLTESDESGADEAESFDS
jgi:hypothetical protein